MLVEKLLCQPIEDLDAPAAERLLEDLSQARWALETVLPLAEQAENERLVERFRQWRRRLNERQERIAAIYSSNPNTP